MKKNERSPYNEKQLYAWFLLLLYRVRDGWLLCTRLGQLIWQRPIGHDIHRRFCCKMRAVDFLYLRKGWKPMKYGCIGEHLPHSFSKEIHAYLNTRDYTLRELAATELDGFFAKRDFCGINVTIPYKKAVIPYLDEIDSTAERIGAVNTIVNRDGRLCGYNTDFGGMRALMMREGIDPLGKKVLVLGAGGTSGTAVAVAEAMGATEILTVSRTARGGAILYEDACEKHADAEIIINTTPCGMYPNPDGVPIDISRFFALCGVVDAVYNPIRTTLVSNARRLGIPAVGGLYMLVAQAVLASALFTDAQYGEGVTEEIYQKILAQKQNIVLIGMPGSGKTTVGRFIASACGRELIDTDSQIVERSGMEIGEIFSRYGEAHFRRLEREAVREAAARSGCVIATGGGAILAQENVEALQKNGKLYFLDRPLEELIPTEDRPLASTVEAIQKRYRERYTRYVTCADEHIKTLGKAKLTAEEIIRRHEG